MLIERISSHSPESIIRSRLKKVFSPDIGVEASTQVLGILEYVCGLILGLALISTENPDFDMASNGLYLLSNTLRTASAISRLNIGLEINARMPMLKASCSSILELKPVQSITGMSDFIFMNSSANFSPVI
jgi:hypothetical protein